MICGALALLVALVVGFALFVRSLPERERVHAEACPHCKHLQNVADGWRLLWGPCDPVTGILLPRPQPTYYVMCHACGELLWLNKVRK